MPKNDLRMLKPKHGAEEHQTHSGTTTECIETFECDECKFNSYICTAISAAVDSKWEKDESQNRPG